MQITTIDLDLAKSVFQVHGIDATGQVVVRKSLRRSQMLPFFAKLPSCLVGMEACGTSHHWARELIKLGHEVRLMPPAYVKPYGAPRRRVLPSGGRIHPESCRLIW
jgi:transposase